MNIFPSTHRSVLSLSKDERCIGTSLLKGAVHGSTSSPRTACPIKKKSIRKGFLVAVILLTVAGAVGCYPVLKKEAERPEEALRQILLFSPRFHDDMDRDSLILAIRRNLDYLNRLHPETVFHYGPHDFTAQQVRESQEAFLYLLLKDLDASELNSEITKKFRVYRATGRVGDRQVLFTGYFEPLYEGSLTPDETFRYPLYRPPDNLVRIDLSLFSEKFKGENIIARIEGKKVLPYYSRYQIEAEKVLEEKNLEIAWLKDPLDVAFLHIQGSGRLKLPDGRDLLVHYQASNGRPYRSIGRHMIERGFLAREEMSMQTIRRYLTENRAVLDEVLNHNPSYIFFRQVEKGPLGSLGVLLTPGRSVALDSRIFPRGALGFISCQKPTVTDQGDIIGWTQFSRFVLNQDTGGAIRGAGRADIFWGNGPYAELAAGHLQHDGDLYILIKK
ncbi:MAG TPA: MltA domain-containing protein [Thermodesulfobacteriota bacterium]|nr:MltA domain-containing protein [Thermodesulfobacteriota bacterium]